MSGLVRFGVSLPRKLVEEFDKKTSGMGYFNRSKAISDALRLFLSEKDFEKKTGEVVCCVAYFYDHHVSGVTEALTRVQHDYGDIIVSSMHAHVSHSDCVEVLIARGFAEKIKALADKIACLRGVLNARLLVLA